MYQCSINPEPACVQCFLLPPELVTWSVLAALWHATSYLNLPTQSSTLPHSERKKAEKGEAKRRQQEEEERKRLEEEASKCVSFWEGGRRGWGAERIVHRVDATHGPCGKGLLAISFRCMENWLTRVWHPTNRSRAPTLLNSRQEEAEEAKRQAAEAKRQREVDKKALKKERQRLRALVESCGGSSGRLLNEDDTERLAQGLDTATLARLSDAAGADGMTPEQRREVLEGALQGLLGAEEAAARERERQKREAAEAIKVRAPRLGPGRGGHPRGWRAQLGGRLASCQCRWLCTRRTAPQLPPPPDGRSSRRTCARGRWTRCC